jgi:tetratricopeptide (TPR) repeat protein
VRSLVLACALGAAASLCHAAGPVAVLPFFNHFAAQSPNLDWVGESIAESIRESLDSQNQLVLEREDREEVYRRLAIRKGPVLTKATVIRLGQTLDAHQVIFGEYTIDGAAAGAVNPQSPLKIAVHVIDLENMRAVNDFEESGPLMNLSQLELKISFTLLQQLAPNQALTEAAFLRDRPTVRLDAMESYIRGLIATNADQRGKLFSQAARLDDHFSQPQFQLGRMAFEKKDYRTAATYLPRVTRGDSHYRESLFLLGICLYYQGNFDAAADRFRTVAAEIPLDEVLNNLGATLSRINDQIGAEDNFRKALEGDEGDPDYWFNVGYSLWKQGKYDLAADKFRATLDRNSADADATTLLGRCLRREGPRPGDPRSEGRERIKTAFEDSAWRQLQAELQKH